MEHRLQAKEIEPKLKQLSCIASSVEPGLATRLDEIWRWIKDIKPGLLTKKKFLMVFLLELINDVEFCLDLKGLTDEERKFIFAQMTPSEKYWYEFIFEKWFNERDPKFYIWKQKLRSEEFKQDDGEILSSVAREIQSRGYTVVHRYIIDLSMATDLITSGRITAPLCIQLTSIGNELHLEDKYKKWQQTLGNWQIDRGLFVSFNPNPKNDGVNRIVNVICFNSDNFADYSYRKLVLK